MTGQRTGCLIRSALALGILLSSAEGPLWAFQSAQVATFSAGITFGTPSSFGKGSPHMAHAPATNAYPVSGILQIGGIISQSPVSFAASRLARPRTGTDRYEVTLSYKTADSVVVATQTLQGVDPFQFVFTVPSGDVVNSGGSVQYRLDVTDLNTNFTTAFPAAAGTYQTVTVGPVTAGIPPEGGRLTYTSGVLKNDLSGYVSTTIDFPEGDGGLQATLTESNALGVSGLATRATASNRYALSPYPEAYRFTTVPDNFPFSRPLGVTLWYPTTSLASNARAIGVSSNEESSLGTFTYDLFRGQWLPAASNQDKISHTMSTQIMGAGSAAGYLAIFESAALAPQDFRPPQKIITPNGDGINDTLNFGNLGSDATIDIYDVTGRRVRHLAGAFVWDGRDDSGNIVPSGVYIYQYQLNGQMVSGVVAVAK